jgi:AraC-like DNA-binding protein
MNKQDKFYIEMEMTINEYVRYAGELSKGEEYQNALMNASVLDELDYTTVKSAIYKICKAIKDLEENIVSNVDEPRSIRKKLEELSSILHISRSHVDNAIKRTLELRPSGKTVTRKPTISTGPSRYA